MTRSIEELSHKALHLSDPAKQIGKTNFFLAYHGLNNKTLQEKIAAFYLQSCPGLGWQPNLKQSPGRNDGQLRIGIISRYLRNHTIGYLNHGVIEHLDPSEIVIEQGFEMHRPSHILVGVEEAEGKIRSVQVGGQAITVLAGNLLL